MRIAPSLQAMVRRSSSNSPGTPERSSAEEQAQKLQALARDIDKYIAARLAPFEDANTRLLCVGAACPTGWQEDAAFRDHFLRGPDSSGGSVRGTGGSDTHDHDMGHGHTASSSAIPAHTHSIGADGGHNHAVTVSAEGIVQGDGSSVFVGQQGTYVTGVDGSHSHSGATGSAGGTTPTITVADFNGDTGASSNVPVFLRVLVCRKS